MPKAIVKKTAKKSPAATKKSSSAKTSRPAVSTVKKPQVTSAPTKTSVQGSRSTTTNVKIQKAMASMKEALRKPKVFVPLIVVIILGLLFLFRSSFVVALVNGQPISRMEYNQQLEAQAGKQVMNSLVTQLLVEQEASRRHISVSQSDLDTQVRTIQNQLAAQGQTLDSALAAQGLSRSEFMTQLRLQALVQKMLADKIKVTDAEVADYISKNQSTLPTGETDAQVKAQVRQQLQQQKLSTQAQALVQQLQAKAHITYFVNL